MDEELKTRFLYLNVFRVSEGYSLTLTYNTCVQGSSWTGQGFLVVKMKPSLRKLYERHHDLINRYGISMSQITTDIYPSSLMAYNLIIDKSKSTGATSRSGTATLPVHLCGVRASLVFYVVLCRSYYLSFFEEGGLHCIICPSNYQFGLPLCVFKPFFLLF